MDEHHDNDEVRDDAGRGEDAPPLGEREWRVLLAAAGHSAFPCRDRAILSLFWHFGATVRQVTGLRAADVDLPAGTLAWPSGGGASLPLEVTRTLQTYVSLERPRHAATLFCGRGQRALTARDVDRCFRRLARVSGIRADPLSLRRAALYRLLRAAPLQALTLRPVRPPERDAARVSGREGL